MKNALVSLAVATFSFFLHTTLSAQKTATWKGGTPGRAQEWTCAANWKEGRVPDEFSDVVIPDVSGIGGFQPVIRGAAISVNSISILPGAVLRIEKTGALDVFESLETIATGALQNNGLLHAPLSENALRNQETQFASNR